MADVSGTWLGTYWQLGVPTRFEATLVQGGSAVSGSILDDCDLGEAQLSGAVAGRAIQFTKRYLVSSPEPVHYTGTVSEDAEFMQGTWSISKRFSGPWEARRSGDNLVAELQTRRAERVSLMQS